jgi:hypothetical protein
MLTILKVNKWLVERNQRVSLEILNLIEIETLIIKWIDPNTIYLINECNER